MCECVCDVSGCICVYMGVCFPKAILNQNVKKKKKVKGEGDLGFLSVLNLLLDCVYVHF